MGRLIIRFEVSSETGQDAGLNNCSIIGCFVNGIG